MTSRTTIMALGAAALVAGCHAKDQKTAPTAPVEKGMPLEVPAGAKGKGVNVNAEIMRMHRVAGRWQSQPGALPGGKDEWIVLDVSNDNRFSLEVRSHGKDPKIDAVDVSVTGKIAWTPEGILTGSGTGAKAPIKDFAQWRASFPSAGHITLRGSGNQTYDLTYRGL